MQWISLYFFINLMVFIYFFDNIKEEKDYNFKIFLSINIFLLGLPLLIFALIYKYFCDKNDDDFYGD